MIARCENPMANEGIKDLCAESVFVPRVKWLKIDVMTVMLMLFANSCPALSGQLSKCVFDNYSDAVVRTVYKFNEKSKAPGETHGSGFLIQETGFILTANHNLRPESDEVVSTSSVKVKLPDSKMAEQDAEVIGQDDKADVALLKIHRNKDPWPTVPIGTLDTIWKVGDLLAGLGYANGGDLSIIDDAHITALNAIVGGAQMPWWQTSLLINHGDSGGPIFGEDGKVRALAIAKDDNAQGISFVLPLAEAKRFLDKAGVPQTSSSKCSEPFSIAPEDKDCELSASITWELMDDTIPLYVVLTAGGSARYLVNSGIPVALHIPSAHIGNWSLALVWSDKSKSEFGSFSGCSIAGRKESEDKRAQISFQTL